LPKSQKGTGEEQKKEGETQWPPGAVDEKVTTGCGKGRGTGGKKRSRPLARCSGSRGGKKNPGVAATVNKRDREGGGTNQKARKGVTLKAQRCRTKRSTGGIGWDRKKGGAGKRREGGGGQEETCKNLPWRG